MLVWLFVTHFPLAFSDYGTIKKVLAPMNQNSSSCLLEEIELLPKSQREPIRSLQILHSQSVLFVGLQEHVIKVPLKRCPFYKTYRYEESASFIWLEKNTCRGLQKNGKDKWLQVGIQINCLRQQWLPLYSYLSEVSLTTCTNLLGLDEVLNELYSYWSVIMQILNCEVKQ